MWEYDRDFKLVEKHELSFSSPKGIQTLNFDGKYWCFGIYNNPAMTVVADENFQLLGKRNFNSAVGFVTIPGQGVFRVRSIRKNADGKKLYSGGLLKIPGERLIIGEMSEKMLVKP